MLQKSSSVEFPFPFGSRKWLKIGGLTGGGIGGKILLVENMLTRNVNAGSFRFARGDALISVTVPEDLFFDMVDLLVAP
ncbi:MAG: hypothetical protein R6X05_00280 [Desulfobacterales bacterium]